MTRITKSIRSLVQSAASAGKKKAKAGPATMQRELQANARGDQSAGESADQQVAQAPAQATSPANRHPHSGGQRAVATAEPPNPFSSAQLAKLSLARKKVSDYAGLPPELQRMAMEQAPLSSLLQLAATNHDQRTVAMQLLRSMPTWQLLSKIAEEPASSRLKQVFSEAMARFDAEAPAGDDLTPWVAAADSISARFLYPPDQMRLHSDYGPMTMRELKASLRQDAEPALRLVLRIRKAERPQWRADVGVAQLVAQAGSVADAVEILETADNEIRLAMVAQDAPAVDLAFQKFEILRKDLFSVSLMAGHPAVAQAVLDTAFDLGRNQQTLVERLFLGHSLLNVAVGLHDIGATQMLIEQGLAQEVCEGDLAYHEGLYAQAIASLDRPAGAAISLHAVRCRELVADGSLASWQRTLSTVRNASGLPHGLQNALSALEVARHNGFWPAEWQVVCEHLDDVLGDYALNPHEDFYRATDFAETLLGGTAALSSIERLRDDFARLHLEVRASLGRAMPPRVDQFLTQIGGALLPA